MILNVKIPCSNNFDVTLTGYFSLPGLTPSESTPESNFGMFSHGLVHLSIVTPMSENRNSVNWHYLPAWELWSVGEYSLLWTRLKSVSPTYKSIVNPSLSGLQEWIWFHAKNETASSDLFHIPIKIWTDFSSFRWMLTSQEYRDRAEFWQTWQMVSDCPWR